ncbi:SUKH-4 family immunity protein [Streptomyces griseoaurantiacus]|uniref:SUKH-4 family immunity protein n=1 Tax=Streptomyces griseoaurantiacus TaxID=68213 RepID=UPI00368FE909
MVTYAQAQERAEEWINGDVPAYQHREVRVREFELGFVVWAEDRAEGPRSDGGAQRLVLARDSGEVTLWPSLPVGEVIRRYEEEYGRPDAVPQDAPPPAPARMDLNQTSFLLTPPEWLQEAADRLGIPDQRRDRTSGGAAGVAAGAPETAGTGVPGAEGARGDAGEPGGAGAVGAGADAGRAVASGASAGADAPGAPEGGARWPAPTAGEARDAGAGPQDRLPGAPPGATPWTGTDITVDADDEDRSVALPATVFAPPLSAPDEESAPAAGTEAKTALMSGGSALPPTTVAPAVDTPGGPAAPSSYGYPAPGAPPAGNAPGGPGAPQYGYPPQAPAQGGQPAAGGAAGLAGAETRKAPPPGGAGSGSVPPPGAPGAPGAPYAAPAAPPPSAPGAPAGGAPQTPGGTPPGGVHHAATMLAGPSVGGPGVPPPPGAPGGAQVPPPGAPGAPAGPGVPQPPDAPGVPAGGAPQAPGTPPGGVHHAATMLAGPSVGGPGAPPPPPPPGAPGGVQVPPPGAPGVPGANPPQAPGGTPPGGVHHAATMLAGPAVGGPGAPQAPGAPGAPAGSGGVHHAETVLAGPAMGGPGVPPPPGAPGMPPGAVPPPPPPPPVPGMPGGPGAPGGAYGYPPAGQPTVGPGYQAVLRYRAQDGSEQQLIRRSAPGTPHPEWQIFHELRGLNVPSDQVLELHTELESCHLPGAYCARMIGEQWPNARITSIAPYGTDHASRQQGMQQLLAHQGELHQVADGPARPAPVRTPIPPVPPAPPVPPEGIAHELAAAFGPGVFRFDQAAVSRQGVPPVVAHTLVVAGLPVDMGPFFWAQAQPGRPVPTLAELAQERGVRPAADAGSYLVMGSDFGKALCVQYGTANIVAVPVEAGPDGASAPPQFVNTGLPEFARCLALLGRMWRLRYGLNQEQAGRWTVDFQAQLAALDPAALNSPESWWSVLLEQMWDGLL